MAAPAVVVVLTRSASGGMTMAKTQILGTALLGATIFIVGSMGAVAIGQGVPKGSVPIGKPITQLPAAAGTGIDQAAPKTVTVKSMPPVVVKTELQAGDTQVDAAAPEIRVTFSKEMADKSWSWSQISDDTFPKVTGKPAYDKDRRTCVLPVKLETGKTYVIWLNSEKFKNFKDTGGEPAVPYLLVFETKK
jgi:hypothetical protein